MRPPQLPTIRPDAVPEAALLLDVREDDEWAAGHIDGAVHVPMYQVPQHVAHSEQFAERPGPIVVVCKVGGRSAQVTAWLLENGYDAVNLAGGMLAWQAAGHPMVSEDDGPPTVL